MARGDDWLDEQPIDSFVLPGGLQTKGREIDFRVPLREERVISLERASELRREIDAGAPGAAAKAISELLAPQSTRIPRRMAIASEMLPTRRRLPALHPECATLGQASLVSPD